MTALFRIVGLWRPQAAWLLAGGLVSLAALASLLGLLANSAAFAIGGAVAGGLTLRLLGTSRVVLRYFERLITHSALFRALAGLRVWFFRGLALRAAGGWSASTRRADASTRRWRASACDASHYSPATRVQHSG